MREEQFQEVQRQIERGLVQNLKKVSYESGGYVGTAHLVAQFMGSKTYRKIKERYSINTSLCLERALLNLLDNKVIRYREEGAGLTY